MELIWYRLSFVILILSSYAFELSQTSREPTISANSLNLIVPSSIKIQTNDSYVISSVSPSIINNDDIVTITYSTLYPSSSDWIGAYIADSDITTTSPIKFGDCGDRAYNSNYLTLGYGSLYFNITNFRTGIKFYYFTNGLTSPVNVANSSTIVTFFQNNQPLRNRVTATGNMDIYQIAWNSLNSSQPVVKWGTSSNELVNAVTAATTFISKSSLCGKPATAEGWIDLGPIHTANITGIVELQRKNIYTIYYVFGDGATGEFSPLTVFRLPPPAGMQPTNNRPLTLALMADMGVGSTDSSRGTSVYHEACPPAANTSNSVGYLVQQGLVDAVIHNGDLSYADGYLAGWQFFLDMISPISGSVLYFTTVGNHESDFPDSSSIFESDTSGGECGVLATNLLTMPEPASTNQPWWSYDIGLIHVTGISSEHNFSIGSPQHAWLENDLKSVDRSVTPWILFNAHRPMYVDSMWCCNSYDDDDCSECYAGSDVQVMRDLQKNVEPLLYKYNVSLGWSGHFHDIQRQSAVYQGTVVQRATMTTDAAGNSLALHDRPTATVWMLMGSSGNGPSIADINYTWSERYWDYTFGYALLTAVNDTYLLWETIESSTNRVVDRMAIIQDPWPGNVDDDGDNNKSSSSGYSLTVVDVIVISVVSACTACAVLLLVYCYQVRISSFLAPFVLGSSKAMSSQENNGGPAVEMGETA